MMKEFIKLECSGSAQENIGNSDISNFSIGKPNYNEQEKIATFLDQKIAEFDNIIAKKQAFIDKLTEAKKVLYLK